MATDFLNRILNSVFGVIMQGCIFLSYWKTIQIVTTCTMTLHLAENIQLVSETISKAYYCQMKQLSGRRNFPVESYPQIPVVYTGQWVSPEHSTPHILHYPSAINYDAPSHFLCLWCSTQQCMVLGRSGSQKVSNNLVCSPSALLIAKMIPTLSSLPCPFLIQRSTGWVISCW